jgi:hypothetical protein
LGAALDATTRALRLDDHHVHILMTGRMLGMARGDEKTTEKAVNTRTPKTRSDATAVPREQGPNPVWFKPIMFGFMLLGLVWIIVFYLSAGAQYPIPQIGPWNIAVGFGIMFIGFLMTTRWR